MITATIDKFGLDKLKVEVTDYITSLAANTQRAMLAAGYLLEGEARETILQGPPRSGEVYERGGKSAQRSAPGEPAKSDTGILQSSLHVIQAANGNVTFGYLDGIAPYGKYLEDKSKLDRQVLWPTTEKNWINVERLLIGALSGKN
jgi:hypothetical protein